MTHRSLPPGRHLHEVVAGARVGGFAGALIGGGLFILTGWPLMVVAGALAGVVAGYLWARRDTRR